MARRVHGGVDEYIGYVVSSQRVQLLAKIFVAPKPAECLEGQLKLQDAKVTARLASILSATLKVGSF